MLLTDSLHIHTYKEKKPTSKNFPFQIYGHRKQVIMAKSQFRKSYAKTILSQPYKVRESNQLNLMKRTKKEKKNSVLLLLLHQLDGRL